MRLLGLLLLMLAMTFMGGPTFGQPAGGCAVACCGVDGGGGMVCGEQHEECPTDPTRGPCACSVCQCCPLMSWAIPVPSGQFLCIREAERVASMPLTGQSRIDPPPSPPPKPEAMS